MTSAEEIAAALERWNAARRGTVTDRARESGDEMALLLRAELDAEPEPVPEAVRAWCAVVDEPGMDVRPDIIVAALRAHFAAKYQGREVEP